MHEPSIIIAFYDWLNEQSEEFKRLDAMTANDVLTEDFDWGAYHAAEKSWEELGLRPDAPQSAKDAFEEYVKIEEWARSVGAHV
jgi:DNA-binding SARP family transcriptional activator